MNSTWELFVAKAKKDGISVNLHKSGNSHFSANMLILKTFPTLIQSKLGNKNMIAKPGFTLKNSPKIQLGL